MFKNLFKSKKRKLWERYKKGEFFVTNVLNFSNFIFPENIGREEIFPLINGKKGVFFVINVGEVDDWGSGNIQLMFLGYGGEKRIRDCTFEEFTQIYYKGRIK